MKKHFLFSLLMILTLHAFGQTPQLVKDIHTGSQDSYYGPTISYNGKLIFMTTNYFPFSSYNQLWVADQNGNSELLKTFYQNAPTMGGGFKILNNKVYFAANDSLHGNELWVTDGTVAGTQMVIDINSGTSSAITTNRNDYILTVMNGKLYFAANDGIHGVELWSSDGTDAGTQMVKDINPSGNGLVDSLQPTCAIAATDTKVFFSANDGVHGTELWMTDGTNTGTQLVKDFDTTGSGGSTLTNFFIYNNKVYFTLTISSTFSNFLYSSDGTSAGTIFEQIYPMGYIDHIVFNNNLYMLGKSTAGVKGLYDISNIYAPQEIFDSIYAANNTTSGLSIFLTTCNNRLYFINKTASNHYQLVESDGSPIGTQVVIDFSQPPYNNEQVASLTSAGNKLYFRTVDNSGSMNIWVSDGTSSGTSKLAFPHTANNAILVASRQLFLTAPITSVDSNLFFSCRYDSAVGNELYKLTIPYTDVKNVNNTTNKIKLYPNPAHNELSVSCADASVIEVFDISGKCVYTSKTPGTQTFVINTGTFIPGIYVIQCSLQNGQRQYARFIKE